ncbi:MAG: hypothetical protein U1F68_02550 [Gammaproteobacteria bacterium]
MNKLIRIIGLLLIVALSAIHADAQPIFSASFEDASLRGRLLDTTDAVANPPVQRPVVGARVSILGQNASALSDAIQLV